MKKLAKKIIRNDIELSGRTESDEGILRRADRSILLTVFREGMGSIAVNQHVTKEEAMAEFCDPKYCAVTVEVKSSCIKMEAYIHNKVACPTPKERFVKEMRNHCGFTDLRDKLTAPTAIAFDEKSSVMTAKNPESHADVEILLDESGAGIDLSDGKTYASGECYINSNPSSDDDSMIELAWDASNDVNDGIMSDESFKAALEHDRPMFPEGIVRKPEWEHFRKFAKLLSWGTWDDLLNAYRAEKKGGASK